MIVHDLKTIFIHIPKTAGVSLVHAVLTEVLGYETSGRIKDLPRGITNRFVLGERQKHKKANQYVPRDITKARWNEYYKFAFVRNPWDKVVSEYHWRKTQKDPGPEEFDVFVKHCENRVRGSRRGIYWIHAQPQISFVTNKRGDVIVDDIFKFEELDKAVESINEQLNISLKLKKHNTSKHNNYREYYNEETRKMIHNLYREDIETFRYMF